MEWHSEWNDIRNMQMILEKDKQLSSKQKKQFYDCLEQKKRLLFASRLGDCFLKEYARILHGLSAHKLKELEADVQGMHNVLRRGLEWKGDIWEELYFAVVRDHAIAFYTDLGAAFLELYQEKRNLANNRKYQDVLSDFQKIEHIYRNFDPAQESNGEKIARVLTENEAELFHTWLGHSFVRQLQRNYLKKKLAQNRRLRMAAMFFSAVFLAGMISFLSVGIYVKVQDGKKIRDLQNQKNAGEIRTVIADDRETSMPQAEETGSEKADEEPEEKTEPPEVLEQYRKIAQQYPDFFGWVTVSGTRIDYPVMQSQESGYYLDHDYTGEPSLEGAVFVDEKVSCDPPDNFVVVYGHNMKNGNVFGELKKFESEEFLSENPVIRFDTAYEMNEFEIAAVLKTRILYESEEGFRYYQTFGYQSEAEFQDILDFIRGNAIIGTGGELNYGDEILMLSTCEYSQENGRLVVVAKKKSD